MNTLQISLTFCPHAMYSLLFHSSVLQISLASAVHINMAMNFLTLPLALVSVSVSYASITCSYIYLLLFTLYSHVIPLYWPVSPLFAFFFLFFISFLILIASWMSTASHSYCSPFLPPALFSFFFLFYPRLIFPSIRIYANAESRQENSRGDVCERETRESRDQSDHQIKCKHVRVNRKSG